MFSRSFCIYVATATFVVAQQLGIPGHMKMCRGTKAHVSTPRNLLPPCDEVTHIHHCGLTMASMLPNPSGPFSNKSTHRFEELLPHFG